MKAWVLAVNPENGDVVMTYHHGSDFHICIDMDAEEFSQLAGMINGALGDSKLAAS